MKTLFGHPQIKTVKEYFGEEKFNNASLECLLREIKETLVEKGHKIYVSLDKASNLLSVYDESANVCYVKYKKGMPLLGMYK